MQSRLIALALVFVSCGPDGQLRAGGAEPAAESSDASSAQRIDAGSVADAGQPFDAGAPPSPQVCDLAPVNTPASPNQTGFAPGPVFRLRSSVYYIRQPDGVLREKVVINGRTQVFVGDVVFFDSTQKNAALEVCQWADDPTYTVRDVGCGFERLSSSNPFLLKLLVVAPAVATIVGTLDGVSSETPVVVEAH